MAWIFCGLIVGLAAIVVSAAGAALLRRWRHRRDFGHLGGNAHWDEDYPVVEGFEWARTAEEVSSQG